MRCVKFIRCPIWLQSMLSNANRKRNQTRRLGERDVGKEGTTQVASLGSLHNDGNGYENSNYK